MNRLIEAIAEAAGASLGAVRRIDYTWNEVHFTSEVTYSAPEMSEGHSAMPDIEPNSISGSEEVQVKWELCNRDWATKNHQDYVYSISATMGRWSLIRKAD